MKRLAVSIAALCARLVRLRWQQRSTRWWAAGGGVLALLGVLAGVPTEAPAAQLKLPSGAEACAVVKFDNGRKTAVVYAIDEARQYQGVDFFFARFGRDGEPLGEPLDVGWGYHLDEVTCGLAARDGEFSVVWPHYDDLDNDAELLFARIGDGHREGLQRLHSSKLGTLRVRSFVATTRGYELRFFVGPGRAPQVMQLDPSGREINGPDNNLGAYQSAP